MKIKINTFQILTIISVLGMIIWSITGYFGGIFIHLIQYWYLILPILILYLITLFGTIIKFFKSDFKSNKLILGVHLIFIIFVIILSLIQSDIFKSKTVLSGTLKDDLFHYTLVLREDNTCEINTYGFLGFQEKQKGKYRIIGNAIIFLEKPYDNNFIPDTLYLDKSQNAIFLNKKLEKVWLNYFELD